MWKLIGIAMLLLLNACSEERKLDPAACEKAWIRHEEAQQAYDDALAGSQSGSMLNGLRKKVETTRELALETCQGKERWELL